MTIEKCFLRCFDLSFIGKKTSWEKEKMQELGILDPGLMNFVILYVTIHKPKKKKWDLSKLKAFEVKENKDGALIN